ncbi:MAG: DUF4129 domain-containing protein [Chloroflexi bacterium]|nr:MAG: DUF4129 domain-containing protein [Chloroflexota bacterium]
MLSLRPAVRALFPPIDPSRLAFRGGIFALLLGVALVILYPVSLDQAGWVQSDAHFGWLAILGLLFGSLVGNSRVRRGSAPMLGAIVGMIAVVALTTMSAGPQPFHVKLVTLATNVNNWLTQVLAGEAGTDPTPFVLFLGATCWSTAFWGSYALARFRRPWDLVFFQAFILVVNVSLALRPLFFDLVVFSVLSLLLLARLHVVSLSERWERRRLVPGADMEWRVLRGGLTWTLVLIMLASFTPRIGAADALGSAWGTFEGPWHSVENEWQRFFAGVYGPSRIQGVSFSDVIRLGLAPNLGDKVVMYITASESHFLRATAYDFYTGVGWKSNDDRQEDKTDALNYAGRKKLDVTIDPVNPKGALLFAPSEPVQASIPRTFIYGEDKSFSSQMRAKDRAQATGRYIVTSAVSIATKEDLRRAGAAPAAITERYDQLPTTVPARVRQLAAAITRDKTNAYDKAEAIELYLRTNFKYSTVVKAPPSGRDPVDYFLFDLKEDFCEYFASSMVVMLRSVGVPARVVEGYTMGTFDEPTGRYMITERNAHAWVEVYFAGYGWIEFEPTPSEAVVSRPETAVDISATSPETGPSNQSPDLLDRCQRNAGCADDQGIPQGDSGADSGAGTNLISAADFRPLWWGALLAAILALLGYIRFQLRFRRMRAADAAFGKMRLLAAYAGMQQRPYQTVSEYAGTLGQALPRVERQVHAIARAQVIERYSPRPASDAEAQAARRALRAVSWELLRRVPRRLWRGVRGIVAS